MIELPLRIESCANKREQIEARLWARSEPIPECGCWLWTGNAVAAGHGRIWFGGTKWLVHRLAYAAFVGAIPEGAVVMHRCDTPNCWNPSHLRHGSQIENVRDRDRKGRTARGERHARLKGEANGLTTIGDADVRRIRVLYLSGASQSSIAAQYGICQMTVSNIVRRKTWGHVE